MDNTQKIQSKEDILALIDKIENNKTQVLLLKLFTSVFIGAADKTQGYFDQLKEFNSDPAVKALLLSLAYIFQMNKVFRDGQKSNDQDKNPTQEEKKDGEQQESVVQDSKS